MKFFYKEKELCVDLKKAIEIATGDDYVDLIDSLGVIIHKQPEFIVMILYDTDNDSVSIEIMGNNDEYEKIKEENFKMTDDERELIVKELSVL